MKTIPIEVVWADGKIAYLCSCPLGCFEPASSEIKATEGISYFQVVDGKRVQSFTDQELFFVEVQS